MRQYLVIVCICGLVMMGCDDIIHPVLEPASPIYVVDAFITNRLDSQVVRLMYSQPYFEQELPPGATGAVVKIMDKADPGIVFEFIEHPLHKGNYYWVPQGQGFGSPGNTYILSITVNGEELTAESRMGFVPPVDSVTFEKGERFDGSEEPIYNAQFWATDLPGLGNTYWIRANKNGVLLNKPRELNLAYDAAFAKGSNFDGYEFIQPIRNGINSNDVDDEDRLISPYLPGDSVYVEIYSLTEASFDFLSQVRLQTDRPGGFSEMFASPLANVSTNIVNLTPGGTKVQGFFNVGSTSGKGKKFVE